MHHSRLLVFILLLVVCILGIIPILLFTTVREESSSTEVEPVSQAVSDSQPITVGVILANRSDWFGWEGATDTGEAYAETTIKGQRVIVFDNLSQAAQSGITLDQVVSEMVGRGAQYIFVSAAYTSTEDELGVTETYPNTVFIMNLATRADVETLLGALPFTASDIGQIPAAAAPTPASAAEPEERPSGGFPVSLVVIGVILLGVAWALTSWWNSSFRLFPQSSDAKKKRARAGTHGKALAIEDIARARMTNFEVIGEPAPVIHRLSTYVNGDTHFDESFPIENGKMFLGECGVGPSEAVNRYDREKIAAFEVWVFDKNDTNTCTRVLLSEHAYHSEALRAKLQTKGDLVLAEPDAIITLETKTLRVRARVLDMQYGFSDTLPQRSFFEHLVVEIAVWQK